MNTADILVETLMKWNVDTIFGIPGDGINGIIEALRRRQDKIKFIQVRHEEAAAFAAVGYAKFTGRLGVCLATSGPGGIHLLNGLYDAKLDGQPVLAITGLQFHDLINTFTQQDVELDKTFLDVARYNSRVMGPNHVQNVTDLACRTALGHRTVSHITIPVDIQEMEAKDIQKSERNVLRHTSHVRTRDTFAPALSDLEEAAAILNSGKKITILAGQGALGAGAEVEEIAKILGAPIVKALLGKACVPDDSEYVVGGIGLLGTRPSEEAMETCDTLLIIGSSFPYIDFLPRPGQARAVQIDIDPMRIGLRYPVECGLVGDCKSTLQHLLPLLRKNENLDFIKKAQLNMKDWNHLMQVRAGTRDLPMKPQVIAHELGMRLPENAIVACDSGTITTWWARHIPVRRGQMHSVSGTLASMACGLPYAIGAAVAFPDRPVFAFVGDGGLSMLMAELATCVKYKLNIKVVVVKNDALGQIKWEQMVMLGNPEYACDLQPIDFAMVARACGAAATTIENPATCGDQVAEILNVTGPALIQAVVDQNEPPMPAKISLEQALHFAEALAKGTKGALEIMKNVSKDRFRELT